MCQAGLLIAPPRRRYSMPCLRSRASMSSRSSSPDFFCFGALT
ncbi:hypothetical protein B005_4145 [Nocardiopsis alba ATCC BAA-2165]|uniref:Uncharacterized protein n=1 Tax=Nocardiopsis alba (strain ATCC BAA-2165 / BE74) TaxID=1205910 RepID=J7LHD2_NOCAA|nr:hypothetical protein B005_4145 [Nocardiopsis alba ATCC BAA-2165]